MWHSRSQLTSSPCPAQRSLVQGTRAPQLPCPAQRLYLPARASASQRPPPLNPLIPAGVSTTQACGTGSPGLHALARRRASGAGGGLGKGRGWGLSGAGAEALRLLRCGPEKLQKHKSCWWARLRARARRRCDADTGARSVEKHSRLRSKPRLALQCIRECVSVCVCVCMCVCE